MACFYCKGALLLAAGAILYVIVDIAIKLGAVGAVLAQIGQLTAFLFEAIAGFFGASLTAGMIASLNKMLAWLVGAAVALKGIANAEAIKELVDTALCKACQAIGVGCNC